MGYEGAEKEDACLSPVFRNGCPDPAADNYDPHATSGIELGGWCQGQYQTGKNCLWDTSTAGTVHVGGFDPDCRVLPIIDPWSVQAPRHIYLVLGGYCIGSGGPGCSGVDQSFKYCATDYKREIIEQLRLMRAEGISFDLEGWLEPAGQPTLMADIRGFVADLRLAMPDLKVILTPYDQPQSYRYASLRSWVDFVTPMMYANQQTYQSSANPVATLQKSIPKWSTIGGWPASKVFLTYQSDSAAGNIHTPEGPQEPAQAHHEVVRYLASEVVSGGYAGLLGWPSVRRDLCPDGFEPAPPPEGDCPPGVDDCFVPSAYGCCIASCVPGLGDCGTQQAQYKDTCEAKGWAWKAFDDDPSYYGHPYTCCSCVSPCSSTPAEATTQAIQAVAVAELGGAVSRPSAWNNTLCKYSCDRGLATHFGVAPEPGGEPGSTSRNCYIDEEGERWPPTMPLTVVRDENLFIQGKGEEGSHGSRLAGRVSAVLGGYIVLRHVDFNSKFEGNGGAVMVSGGKLAIEYVSFRGSYAQSESSGGAVYVTDAQHVWIWHGRFEGNRAEGGQGGALYIAHTQARVTIADSVFSENQARDGAAIMFVTDPHLYLEPFEIVNCAGEDNVATDSDGTVVQISPAPGAAVKIVLAGDDPRAQWGHLTATSNECPVHLSNRERASHPQSCQAAALAGNTSCTVACSEPAEQCGFGESEQVITCSEGSSGVMVLERLGACSGPRCPDRASDCNPEHNGICCAFVDGTKLCQCPPDYRFGPEESQKRCAMDECEATKPCGKEEKCVHSAVLVEGKGYYNCEGPEGAAGSRLLWAALAAAGVALLLCCGWKLRQRSRSSDSEMSDSLLDGPYSSLATATGSAEWDPKSLGNSNSGRPGSVLQFVGRLSARFTGSGKLEEPAPQPEPEPQPQPEPQPGKTQGDSHEGDAPQATEGSRPASPERGSQSW